MRLTPLVLSLAFLSLTACGGSGEHGVSTDPNAATGFITTNENVPGSASNSRDDGIPRDADGRPYTYAFLGKALPDFSGITVGGGTFSSADINQWTVIDVWGIWCGDCMADAPFVAEVAARLSQMEDLDFISIHTPPNAARADEAFGKFGSVERYFDVKGYSYPTVLDTDASLRDLLQIGWTPSYLLVSPDGVVRGYRTDLSVAGDAPVDDFLADIARVRAKHAGIAPRIRKASIGPSGAGGISGMTPFRLRAIEQAFPGYSVISGEQSLEGNAYPVFNIIQTGDEKGPVFTVWPNWNRGHVGIVQTVHQSVAAPNNMQIGVSRLGDLPSSETGRCFDGADGYGNSIICNSGEDRVFQYVFSPARNDESAILRDAAPEVRARAVLSEMRYLPPTPETN